MPDPKNRLNDLEAKRWLQFQKSWFVHNPPPRERGVLLHPAKFPETMIQEFVEFFTKPGMTVLDPMCGTGSVLVACAQCGRSSVGVELLEKYARIAEHRAKQAYARVEGVEGQVITADARRLDRLGIGQVDYCITSPPYWDMLNRKGYETQARRRREGLDVAYSEHPDDLGNEQDYRRFLNQLVAIYRQVGDLLRPGGYLTIIAKNVKKGGRNYPLAWDLGRRVGRYLALKDEKIWCQDNQKLAPYGYRYSWVSNTMHHYCLNFRKTGSGG